MHQLQHQTGLLDLVHDPVPIRGGFQRYHCAGFATSQRLPTVGVALSYFHSEEPKATRNLVSFDGTQKQIHCFAQNSSEKRFFSMLRLISSLNKSVGI